MLKERDIFRWMILVLVFLLLVFNRDMALIYIAIMLADWYYWRLDKRVTFRFERFSGNWLKTILIAGGVYLIFLFVTSILFGLFGATKQYASMAAIISLMGTTTPVLHGSKLLTLVGWGFVIPIVETRFFTGRLFEFFIDKSKTITGKIVSPWKLSTPLLVIIVLVSAMFALFHLTAKGAANVPMLVTFIFHIISCVMLIKMGELKAPATFHVIANSVAVVMSFAVATAALVM